MTSKISPPLGGDWTGLGEGARVKVSSAGGPFSGGTVMAVNTVGGLVKVRFDHGTESWVGRTNVVLVAPAPPSPPAASPTAPAPREPSAPVEVRAMVPVAAVLSQVPVAAPTLLAVAPTMLVAAVPAPDATSVPSMGDAPVARPEPIGLPLSTASEPTVEPTAPTTSWLGSIESEEVRAVFDHLEKHGSITESEAIAKLGSARAFRRFSMEFERYEQRAPFRVRIVSGSEGKRYMKDGDR